MAQQHLLPSTEAILEVLPITLACILVILMLLACVLRVLIFFCFLCLHPLEPHPWFVGAAARCLLQCASQRRSLRQQCGCWRRGLRNKVQVCVLVRQCWLLLQGWCGEAPGGGGYLFNNQMR
jgi:hypothetical protein